ncbi:MAG: DUF4215 domain-containing protein [Phycisphaerales bacterium]|nr:MAG: DUF4215 domain-containing protein [Phycisphaerales bacterium]
MRRSLETVFMFVMTAALLLLGGVLQAQTTIYFDHDNCPGPGSGTLVGPISTQCAIDAVEGRVWETYAGMAAATTCAQSSRPEPERLPLSGNPISRKVRYVSFAAGDPSRSQAIRVTFVNLPAPYDTWNGVAMWVQEPTAYCENAGSVYSPCPDAQPASEFTGATLGCSPWFGDFYSAGVISVFHEGIIPSATYAVQVVDSTCAMLELDFSDVLIITTSRWGDVVEDCTTCPCGPPDGLVNFTDVAAEMDKFKNLAPPSIPCHALVKARAELDMETLDHCLCTPEAVWCLEAFRGERYPPLGFQPPGPPPCGDPVFTCGNEILEPGEQCDDGNRIPGDGCDEYCQSELCGDGTVDSGEECDDGLGNSDTEPDACRTDCTAARCGDDVVDGDEGCDDGNTTPNDGCDQDCQTEPFVGDAVISLVPVSSTDPGATIVEEENRIELSSGGHQVFVNIRVSDWDPGATGLELKAWQAVIDSMGYTSGLQGALTAYMPTCSTQEECEALMGPLGSGMAQGGCGVPGAPQELCAAAFIDNTRTDYIFSGKAELSAVDQSTLDKRYGSTMLGDPTASPGIAQLYAGTLAVDVPVDAAGTFVIDFRYGADDTFLIDENNYLIPLGGLEPALITILRDCNDNGIQDEFELPVSSGGLCTVDCDPDCNSNGIPDECDTVGPTSGDCNANWIPDECDIAGETSEDLDDSGIPDECECATIAEPAQTPDGEAGYQKNRYISFVPRNPDEYTALRVTFLNLPAPFDIHNGTAMWVGEPVIEVSENAGKIDPAEAPDFGTFWSATLRCDPPHYRDDWSTKSPLHVYSDAIVPDAIYQVQAIHQTCDVLGEPNYSAPLLVSTSRWGDEVRNCTINPCGPPDGVVGIPTDVSAVLDKFRNLAGAPTKARTDLEPSAPDLLVNIADVTCVLDAFRGFDYPFGGPTACPPTR